MFSEIKFIEKLINIYLSGRNCKGSGGPRGLGAKVNCNSRVLACLDACLLKPLP